jgi:flagellar basal body P-ring formation protein FlgA
MRHRYDYRRSLCRLALALLALSPAGAFGQTTQAHSSIRRAAETMASAAVSLWAPAGARIDVEASRLDPRLALPACPKALEAQPPQTWSPGARVNIQVRCPVAGGWALYVPVRVQVQTEVLILAAPAARGEPLTAAHLRTERRDVAQLTGGFLTRLEQAEHMVLRRPLALGAVVTAAALETPRLVKRGQRVRLVAGTAGFSVASEGEALTDAAAGDRVRVRHLQSRRIVEGVVDPDGLIRVGGPG